MIVSKRAAAAALAAVVVLAALVGLVFGPRLRPSGAPPHVVVLLLDTVRADAVGGDLSGAALTPRVDEIANRGTSFINATAPAPWTVPSHASLFTGLYPHKHGAVHGASFPVMADSLLMLAERLGRKGYRTAGFTCNPWLHARGGAEQGFDTYVEVYKLDPERPDKGAFKAAGMAIDWIKKRAGRKEPFFLFINFFEPHLPYSPPLSALERIAPDRPPETPALFSVEEAERALAGLAEPSDAELASVRLLYLAEVSYVDRQAGRVLDFLETTGLLENTLLIITSDHGEHLGERGRFGHEFTLYEPALRVPLVVRFPESFPEGFVSDAPVGLIDIVPTVLDCAGWEEANDAFDGRSLLELLEEAASERPLIAEYSRPILLVDDYWKQKYPDVDMSRYREPLKSLRAGDYKYIVSGSGEEALYDLRNDPGETRDLAEELPARRAAMRRALLEAAGPPE